MTDPNDSRAAERYAETERKRDLMRQVDELGLREVELLRAELAIERLKIAAQLSDTEREATFSEDEPGAYGLWRRRAHHARSCIELDIARCDHRILELEWENAAETEPHDRIPATFRALGK